MADMKLKLYQVDAFTDRLFSGNPAAVCPLEEWLPGEVMQQIAMENNLSETAFFLKKGDDYLIRWFTPSNEVDLCGHATLAAAHVLYNHLGYTGDQIVFHTIYRGSLIVRKKDNMLTMNFPADPPKEVPLSNELKECFHQFPAAAYKGISNYMVVFEKESDITSLGPDFHAIAKLPGTGLIATAPGDSSDFVSRFFAPQSGIPEDPVTGSAHTTLSPYWSKRLGKAELSAIQLSPRKGFLQCKMLGDRVEISGQARTYLTGEFSIDN
jgi:PhzF family phenazine biosynthesis protein